MLAHLLRSLVVTLAVMVALCLPLAALALSPELIATDTNFGFSGGKFDTAPDGEALVIGETGVGLPIGAKLHLEIELAAPEVPGDSLASLPEFVGAAASGTGDGSPENRNPRRYKPSLRSLFISPFVSPFSSANPCPPAC